MAKARRPAKTPEAKAREEATAAFERAELEGRRVLVIGLGISGLSAAAFCAARGAGVVAADERPREALDDAAALSALDPAIEVQTGAPLPDLADFDLVVPSPGVPPHRYEGARRAWGDVELAGRALRVPLIAVTGTNGKSTTVRLVEAMLRAAGLRARAAGNIGIPVLSLVGEALDVAVLEVSSFQLEAVEAFRPRVAVILNATPDHLDRHGSFEHYLASKARILSRQEADDTAVLNFDDAAVRALAADAPARVLPFSTRGPLERGVFWDAGRALVRDGDTRIEAALDLSAPALRGQHNIENVVAALATVHALGADVAAATRALAAFEGLPHRCEIVTEVGGIAWINDSKATNTGAALRALEGFSGGEPRVLWIAGGRAKSANFSALADGATGHVRRAFLIGEAAGAIEAALAGRIGAERCPSIEVAVERASAEARPGDVVLLAPACASFDQFKSFEERGERFREAARAAAAAVGADA